MVNALVCGVCRARTKGAKCHVQLLVTSEREGEGRVDASCGMGG